MAFLSFLKTAVALLLLSVSLAAGASSDKLVAAENPAPISQSHLAGARDRMHKKMRNATSRDDDDDDEDEDIEVKGWLAFTAEGVSKRQAKVGSRNALVQTLEVDQWDFTEFAVTEYEPEEEEEDRRRRSRLHRRAHKARKHSRSKSRRSNRTSTSKNQTQTKKTKKAATRSKAKSGARRRLWDEEQPAWRVDWALSLDEDTATEVVAIVEGLTESIEQKTEKTFINLLKQELTKAGAVLPANWELVGFGLTEVDEEEDEDEEDDDEDEDEEEDEEEADEEEEDEDEEGLLGFERPDVLCLNGNCFHETQFYILIVIAGAFLAMIGLLIAGLKTKWVVETLNRAQTSELTRLERDRDDMAITVGSQVCTQPLPNSWKGTVWASAPGTSATKKSYRLFFGPAGKLTGSGQDEAGNTFTVAGNYEVASGKVAWREEQEPAVVSECVGYLRVTKTQGRGTGQSVEARLEGDNVWVTVSEYNPQQPFSGEGWYSYEIAGSYKTFDNYRSLGEGTLELISEAHQAPVKP